MARAIHGKCNRANYTLALTLSQEQQFQNYHRGRGSSRALSRIFCVLKSLNGLSCEGRVEVTLHEVRTHLGVETQRQWSDLAILRTTPSLLGLFSLVTLFAHQSLQGQPLLVRKAAWYAKTLFCMSPSKPDMVEILRTLFEPLTETLAFAA